MKAEISLQDERFFRTSIGKRQLKQDIFGSTASIPLYSANVLQPFDYVAESNISDFDHDYVLWGIDGDFMFNVVHKGTEFATTDHCGAIKIVDPAVVPEYLRYQLEVQGHVLGFDRGLRTSLANMRRVTVHLPVESGGNVDRDAQLALVEKYLAVKQLQSRLVEEGRALAQLIVNIPPSGEFLTVRLDSSLT